MVNYVRELTDIQWLVLLLCFSGALIFLLIASNSLKGNELCLVSTVDSRHNTFYTAGSMVSVSTSRQTIAGHAPAVLIILIVTTLSFFLHLKWCGSMMQHDSATFDQILDLHKQMYPFSARYLTTFSIVLLSMVGLTVKSSYFVLQYLLVVLLGLSFYRYLLTLGFRRGQANLGLFILLTAYPILAAYIEPMHTWDDHWAHLFMVLSFTALLMCNLRWGLLWFVAAVIAREQSLLFLPVVLFAAYHFAHVKKWRGLILFIAVPVLVCAFVHSLSWEAPTHERFALIMKNFETPLRGSDTLFSVFMSFGFMWLTLGLGLFARRSLVTNKLLRFGAAFALPVTLAFVLFFTNARETRLLFPPFLFVVPVSVIVLDDLYSRLRTNLSSSDYPRRFVMLVVFVLLMTAGIVLANITFPAFEYRRCPNFQRLWAGIHFGLIFNLIIYELTNRGKNVASVSQK